MTPFLAYFITISVVQLFLNFSKEESYASIGYYIKLLIFIGLNYYFVSTTPFFDSGLPAIIWYIITGIGVILYPVAIYNNKLITNGDPASQVLTRIISILFNLSLYGWGGAF